MSSEKNRKTHDRLTVTIIGVVIYSIVLIAVMVASYVGVKAVFRNYDKKNAAEAEAETEKETKQTVTETEVTPVPAEEPGKEWTADHEMSVSDIEEATKDVVDYSKILFRPGKRDKSLKWKDKVFSRIENVKDPASAPVNTYKYKRVTAQLPDNAVSEYKVYTDPQTDNVEKITEIEDCNGILQIIDYYYDEGNINYVDKYKKYIDRPVDISSTQIENRYYFANDCLVRYIYCKDGNATQYTLADLDSYSSGTVDQYDYLESEMINRAYIVYNIAPSLKETQMLYGYVMDEFSMPMENAKIIVLSEKDESVIAESSTDGDGYYKVSVECTDDDTFSVTAEKETLGDVGVYGIPAKFGSGKYAVEPIYMGYTDNKTVYPSQFVVRDATDPNVPLSGAGIRIRRGIGNRDGEVVQTGELDDNGTGTVELTSGSYTAEITKGGYETLFLSVIIRQDHQFAVGFAMPDVGEDTYRAVVSWESAPLDLCTKVISSDMGRVITSPVDSLGLTTAECVTIDDAGTDDYRLYVTDFGSITSADVMSYNMTSSCAYVDVYNSDGLIGKFHVPAASAGVVWEVCEIRNKELLPVNAYFYAVDDDDLWKTK